MIIVRRDHPRTWPHLTTYLLEMRIRKSTHPRAWPWPNLTICLLKKRVYKSTHPSTWPHLTK
jgi:hypothetical protein